MAPRADSDAGDIPGLGDLLDRGLVTPPARRLSDVLDEDLLVKLDDVQATSRALDEQRSDRA